MNYPTAGGSVEWAADGRGFYYTRYPQRGERPAEDLHFYQQVYFHELGAPVASDRYVIGKELPRIAEIALRGSRDGSFVLAEVRNGDGGEIGYYLRQSDGSWAPGRGLQATASSSMAFGDDGNLYAMSVKDAPLGRILSIPLSAPAHRECARRRSGERCRRRERAADALAPVT